MMSPRRVVVVAQAETLLTPKRESEAATRAQEQLEALVASPEPQTTLVFVAAAIDKRSRMFRQFAKHATIVDCGALEDQGDAERWIRTRVSAAKVEIEPRAVRLLAARAGPNLPRLRNEVDRLLLYAMGQPRITEADARELAGPASLQDDWAMTNAIESGAAGDALRQLALMLDAGAAPEMILGQLGWLVRSKVPAMRGADVRSGVEAVLRTDLDLKRSAGDPRILLERLVVELCAGRDATRATRGAW
jgi:DNA polymerase-3 subunit delta